MFAQAMKIIGALTLLGFGLYLYVGLLDSSSSEPLPVHAINAVQEAAIHLGRRVDLRGPCTKTDPCKIQLIADLDQRSRVDEKGKNFRSWAKQGELYKTDNGRYQIDWEEDQEVVGQHNEAGRGMELSELIHYNNELLSFDDRTGIVFSLQNGVVPIPKHVIPEGDGNTIKGMKHEWATVKDGVLYMGSFGKEYTGAGGVIVNENNMWVVTLDPEGRLRRYNWKPAYNFVRKQLGAEYPGYCIHEAVNWSPHMNKWVFLPRRVSSEPYDDKADELRGSNKVVLVNEDFTEAEVRTIGKLTPLRGFSSFKFLPASQDQVIIALKSAEISETDQQMTFVTVFNLNGTVLMEETLIPSPYKYEGLEFLP
eukprot:GDKI01006195.1.p1 GENE.GDKI01006195.1~~GDKI01006195.1.p1  ORF type:complete len:422 (+),score=119.61 GDKI01006195.1:171-1268(+)